MSASGIRKAKEDGKPEYNPEELLHDKLRVEKGTIIRLTGLKQKRLNITSIALRRRLARRFSVIGTGKFHVFVDDVEVTVKDRGDLEVVQFLWDIGEDSDHSSYCPDLKEHKVLQGTIEGPSGKWPVRGWIGTATKPKQLVSDAGNLNSIVVLGRGRLLIENILDRINDGRLYTKYLTGQIEADFLDKTELEDIVTSDRQRIQENDERYEALVSFLKATLNRIEADWSEWRRKYAVEEVTKNHPAIAEWLSTLPEGFRDHAKGVIAKVGSIPVESETEHVELLRHAVFAFERLKLKGTADSLAEALSVSPGALLILLADQDILEASLYRDIVKSRVDVIRAFHNLVDNDAKEKVLQKQLFKDLWLLDPSWERATGSPLIESRLLTEGVIVNDLKEKEKLGRVDIAYRTTAGKHVIVELKRAGRLMDLGDLTKQGQMYKDKLKKILLAQNDDHPNIEVVFVIGKPVEEEKSDPDRVKSMMDSISKGSRIVHYDTLISGAINSYQQYLTASEEADKIGKIAERIYSKN
jgi:hypothetical protein